MKGLKKIIWRLCFVVVLGSVLALTGCKSETIPEISNAESEIQSEELSEEVSEDMEEPTEEASEEPLDDKYSAESIIAMMDEAVTKWQYDDPDQMRCMMIAINIEYIKDEDVQKIMSNYGDTTEDLASLYEQYFNDYTNLYFKYLGYLDGSLGKMTDEYNLNKRFFATDYLLDEVTSKKCYDKIKTTTNYLLLREIENIGKEKISLTERVLYDMLNTRTGNDTPILNPYNYEEFYVCDEAYTDEYKKMFKNK